MAVHEELAAAFGVELSHAEAALAECGGVVEAAAEQLLSYVRMADIAAQLSSSSSSDDCDDIDESLARQLAAQFAAEGFGIGNDFVDDDSSSVSSSAIPSPRMRVDCAAMDDAQRATLATAAKRLIVPLVVDLVRRVRVAPVAAQTVDLGRIGSASYGLPDGIRGDSAAIPEDRVDVRLAAGRLVFAADGIVVRMAPFAWWYRKGRLHDNGTATASIANASVRLTLQRQAETVGNKVTDCVVSLGKISVVFGGTRAKLLYDFVLALLKKTIRTTLERAIHDTLVHALESEELPFQLCL